MDTLFGVTPFGFRQTIFITNPPPPTSRDLWAAGEEEVEGRNCPAALSLKTGKRFRRTVAPYASSCQCSKRRVRSPDSCTQNLCIQHAKRSAASKHNWPLLRTGKPLSPECQRREQIRHCCRWDERSNRRPQRARKY